MISISIGGWGGIRTPGGREPTPVFKTGALNHSATHPSKEINYLPNSVSGTNRELSTNWHRIGTGSLVTTHSLPLPGYAAAACEHRLDSVGGLAVIALEQVAIDVEG